MNRLNAAILIIAVAGDAGCQRMKRVHTKNGSDLTNVTFRVTGMMKAKSGAT